MSGTVFRSSSLSSLVSAHANGTLECLVQNLAEGGVSVDHHTELLHGGAGRDGVGTLLDEIGGVDANDVNGNDLAGVLIVQNLGNAGALSLGQGLGVCSEGSLGLAKGPALLLGALNALLFGGSHHGDLGMGEASGGDGVVVDHVGAAGDILDGADALGGGRVGQHHLSVGIADAVDVGDDLAALGLGQDLHLLIDGDEAAVGLDAHVLEAHVGGVGDAAGGNHGGIDLDGLDVLLGLGVDHLDGNGLLPGDAGGDLGGEDAGAVVDGTVADKDALGLLGNFTIEGGHEVGEGLDEGDLGSEGGVDVGEFQADVSRANDGDPLGDELQLESAVGGVDGLFVDGDAGGNEGHRSRGQNDVLGRVNLASGLVLDLVGVASEDAAAFDDLASQTKEGVAQVALDVGSQVLGVVGDALAVVLDLSGDLDAHRLQMMLVLHVADASRGGQEGLARDAATVDAGSADVAAGKDGRGEGLAPRVQRGSVSADAASDDGHVEIVRSVRHPKGRGTAGGGSSSGMGPRWHREGSRVGHEKGRYDQCQSHISSILCVGGHFVVNIGSNISFWREMCRLFSITYRWRNEKIVDGDDSIAATADC